MKFTKNDFLMAENLSIHVDEWLRLEEEERFGQSVVRSVPECHVEGDLHYDGKSRVTSDLHLEGCMIVPDSITDEDLELDFETDSEMVYSFDPLKSDDDQEIVVVKKDTIDLNPEIFQAIVFEAPMSITRLPRDQYPAGNGWALLSDQDKKEDKKEIDPRWAQLSDFKFEDD